MTENVQRRATRCVHYSRRIPYEEHLRKRCPPIDEVQVIAQRSNPSKFIKFFIMLTNSVGGILPEILQDRTRDLIFKLIKHSCSTSLRTYLLKSFLNKWNRFPPNIKQGGVQKDGGHWFTVICYLSLYFLYIEKAQHTAFKYDQPGI